MVGARKTASSQATCWNTKIAAIFLHHDIRGHLRSSENRMLGLVYGEGLRNSVLVSGIVIFPSGLQFFQLYAIGQISVHLVRRHMNKGALGT